MTLVLARPPVAGGGRGGGPRGKRARCAPRDPGDRCPEMPPPAEAPAGGAYGQPGGCADGSRADEEHDRGRLHHDLPCARNHHVRSLSARASVECDEIPLTGRPARGITSHSTCWG